MSHRMETYPVCDANFDQNIDVTVANIIPQSQDVMCSLCFMWMMSMSLILYEIWRFNNCRTLDGLTMSTSNRTSRLASTTRQTTVSGLTPPGYLLSPIPHYYVTYSLRPHTTRLLALSGPTLLRNLLFPASHHQATCSLRSHTTM